jgi:hypothetical protein
MTRRSNTSGASLNLTFANGDAKKTHLVHAPLGEARHVGADSAYKTAQFEYRADLSVTARVGLLLQNAGEATAEEVTIVISVPESLQMTFVEQSPPPKVPGKAPAAPLEPSPRSWQSDTPTRARCRVIRVSSSVGLPPLFLRLKDRKSEGDFPLEATITTARPAAEHVQQLTVHFAHAPDPVP